jgi:hypothetical protein
MNDVCKIFFELHHKRVRLGNLRASKLTKEIQCNAKSFNEDVQLIVKNVSLFTKEGEKDHLYINNFYTFRSSYFKFFVCALLQVFKDKRN